MTKAYAIYYNSVFGGEHHKPSLQAVFLDKDKVIERVNAENAKLLEKAKTATQIDSDYGMFDGNYSYEEIPLNPELTEEL